MPPASHVGIASSSDCIIATGGGAGTCDYRLQVQHTLHRVKADGQCSDRKAAKHPLQDGVHGRNSRRRKDHVEEQ